MLSFELRSILALLAVLGLSGCPGDDSGDDGNDSANATDVDVTTTEGAGETTLGDAETTAGDSSTGGADSTGEAALGDVEVTVIYEGALTGTLKVSAVDYPPMAPPEHSVEDMAPVFPWTGTLADLPVGDYMLLVSIDVGNDSPGVPGPEDPRTATEEPVVVTADGPTTIELVLTDP